MAMLIGLHVRQMGLDGGQKVYSLFATNLHLASKEVGVVRRSSHLVRPTFS